MIIENIGDKSIELHKKHHGKISVESSVPLETREDLALAYTPGVAEVCRVIDKDPERAKELTFKHNSIAVVSDGSAILGLGNLGALAALPVMEGKAALFKRFGDINAVPIVLNTQNVDEIVSIIKAIAPTFGGINLEDISAPRCFEIESRLTKELDIPVMHDDQHGTAIVVLAGLLNALKFRGLDKKTAKILVNGAGSAGVAIVKLLLLDGFENIIVSDSRGALYPGRIDMNSEKEKLSILTNIACRIDIDDPRCITGGLEAGIQDADVFIGVSLGGVLTKDLIRRMHPNPIIFALANPTPEILPEDALAAGASVVATGRSDFPNQINNVLVFPGLFRGALDHKIIQFNDEIFLRAAYNLAGCVQEITAENIIPEPFDRNVLRAVSDAVRM
ncbi:MAG: NADP-dependent malic enzyme [Candidatus Moraniibacteriota bacterium]|nr:MAG: NADP-dependent malic enzyme [Candidatus Moranbacteria bacterium]